MPAEQTRISTGPSARLDLAEGPLDLGCLGHVALDGEKGRRAFWAVERSGGFVRHVTATL